MKNEGGGLFSEIIFSNLFGLLNNCLVVVGDDMMI